ncbi:MAG: hypothetical protein JJE25_00950 [Bacteroidia bacterium]|nr:hypothetical protein [Bacteroidia bacterium]
MNLRLVFIALLVLVFQKSIAQTGGSLHGNFQLDAQYYKTDSLIRAYNVPEKMLMNGFANFIYDAGKFSAGLRYESYLNVLQGFDPRYKGSGIPYRFLRYKNDGLDVTVGNFYEQYGSGIILRSYEERGLGFDNAFEGIKISYIPHPGVTLKALAGNQRLYFDKGLGIVRAADAEVLLNDAFAKLAAAKTKISVGGSFVSKFQKSDDTVFNLPENVGAGSGRINIQRGDFTLNAEYAHKVNDPSSVNNRIYKDGEALLINLAYSKSGFGISLSAKRIDNMNFRSDRDATGNDLLINYLPAMTRQHTYTLCALYPYATQPNGEMGLQAEIFFNIKENTPLGGKYGTNVALNYSRANSIERKAPADTNLIGVAGTDGYTSGFFKSGDELYFEDYNIEVTHKFSSKVKMILDYVYIVYNKDVIQGTPGFGTFYSNIGVAEIIWKMTSKRALRTEIQHLSTKQDQKNWAMLLAELTFAPHWSIGAFDQYNYGNDIEELQIHYYTGTIAFTKNTNRFSIGYGKQREGIFCVGGVCRTVPASNGFTLSITSSF